MKIWKKLQRSERLLSASEMSALIIPVDTLPVASESELGKSYMVVDHTTDTIITYTYKCVKEGDAYVWRVVNLVESGALDPVSTLWANSKIDTDNNRATVFLHWEDPEDKDDAHWAYDVIVRKKGSVPTSMFDGDLVGFSSVRNQYAGGFGFVDSIDGDTVDTSDIFDDTEDTEHTADPSVSNIYHYNVFAVTKYGVATGCSGCLPMLTWEQFRNLVQLGKAEQAVSLGDIITVRHTTFGYIDFQVVDFGVDRYIAGRDVLTNARVSAPKYTVTLMAKDVLFRGSFDHREKVNGDHSHGYDAFFNGSNRWATSNARMWLNSDKVNWFDPKYSADDYSTKYTEDGTYGMSDTMQFPGFLEGLDPELKAVLATVPVRTTEPVWKRIIIDDLIIPQEVTADKVFLASYQEVFGTKSDKFPSDVYKDPVKDEMFGIYKEGVVNTRMKVVMDGFDTTGDGALDIRDHLSSWYTRTPSRVIENVGGNDIITDAVYVVSNINRNYDQEKKDLGQDAGAPVTPYLSANDRDQRDNSFPAPDYQYRNNSSPGFVPCITIA